MDPYHSEMDSYTSAMQRSIVQCIAVLYSALQCIAVLYSALQCSAVWCSYMQLSALQCGAVSRSEAQRAEFLRSDPFTQVNPFSASLIVTFVGLVLSLHNNLHNHTQKHRLLPSSLFFGDCF